MAVPPELVGWKLYVPVRFMVDAAGLEDVWDAEENTLWITTPEQNSKKGLLRWEAFSNRRSAADTTTAQARSPLR